MVAACRSGGQTEQAIRYLQHLLAISPSDAALHLNLADLQSGAGQTTAAAESYRAAIGCNAVLPEAHIGLGHVLKSTGDLRSAAECFRQAISLAPTNEKTHMPLAVHLELGEHTAAAAVFRRAIKLNASYTAGYNNLGHTLQVQGDWSGAIDCYRRAMELDAHCFQAVFNLAVCWFINNSLPLPSRFTAALELRPGNAAAYRRAGPRFAQLGPACRSDRELRCGPASRPEPG